MATHLINEVSLMLSATRLFVGSILLCAGVAGCTPAHFVQRAQPAPRCEVRVCRDLGTGLARCDCKSHEQVVRQGREVLWPRLE